MTAADLVLMMGVIIGSVAALGALLAVLLLWYRGSLRKLAALVAGAGAFEVVPAAGRVALVEGGLRCGELIGQCGSDCTRWP